MSRDIVHLHVHDFYSFLDGFGSPKEHVQRAAELGMTAMAITNHNHVGSCIEFQRACNEEGLKPLLGLESYWTEDINILSLPLEERDKYAIERAEAAGIEIPKGKGVTKKSIKELIAPYEYDTKQYHITFIAINQIGWHNLLNLQSESAEKCTYNGRFLCDDEMISKHKEGLIMLTACIGNASASAFIKGNIEKGYDRLDKWKEIFGDKMYVEIQPLNIEKQWIANNHLIKWAKDNDVKVVATNDVHYTNKEDHDDHDTLLCIGIGKTKDEEDRMRYSNDFWIKSYDEMIESFDNQIESMKENDFPGKELFNEREYRLDITQSIENTNYIPDLCENIKLGSDVPLFPELKNLPEGMTPEDQLNIIAYQKLYEYKDSHPEIDLKAYEERLSFELDVINSKGFAPYFLIVKEYIDWADSNDCPIGPGRGSVAGSLTAFVAGITKVIDPIKYNLLFFRFLTDDRTAPPDIDTDVDYENRGKLIEHLEELYEKENVSHIGTYTYMGVKSGLKDVGRVLKIDFSAMNAITKKIDEILDMPSAKFKDYDALGESENEANLMKYKEFKNLEDMNPELFRLARRFEGTPRNMGVHASGILVTPLPISQLAPTRTAKDGTRVTLYTGEQLEDLGFIKFDLLGLKNLSIIKNTLKNIDPSLTMDHLYNTLDFEDEKIYELIRSKNTEGLFQIESNLFKGMIEDIQPDCFNDIVIMNGMGRPGPLSCGLPQTYARRKNGLEEAKEPLDNTWDIVKDTLGTICFQENIMQIAQRVAGFSGNQTDSVLRKCLAKKKRSMMDMCKQWLIYGKINLEPPEGHDENNLDQPMYDPKKKYGEEIDGAIKRGYEEKILKAFWKDLEGYSDYLFNLSHSACYSYITILTAALKAHYPIEFMTALLSMEEKEEKVEKYIASCEQMGLKVRVPDINLSEHSFSFKKDKKEILFGLSKVKGVGDTSVPAILENRPYQSLADVVSKVPKKFFNKRVGAALIKAGAFDSLDSNRYSLMNEFYDLRKDKDDRLVPSEYDRYVCQELEKETLGTNVTYKPWWDIIKKNSKVKQVMRIRKVTEKVDKNGNMMAFVELEVEKCMIKGLVFASLYTKNVDKFKNKVLEFTGKKDDKGIFIINKVEKASYDLFEAKEESDFDDEENFLNILMS